MDSITLLDTLLLESRGSAVATDFDQRASEIATALSAGLLAEYQALRASDDLLYPLPEDKPARRIAQVLHATWRRWNEDAALVLDRLRRIPGIDSAHMEPLADAHARSMGILLSPMEKIDHSREQARRGEVFSLEEVRRELRAGVHG